MFGQPFRKASPGAVARLFALVLLCLQAGMATAEWTGVSLTFGSYDSDWAFDDETRTADHTELDFRIEQRTASGLAIGGRLGYFDMRVDGGRDTSTQKFDGGYLGIYFRRDYEISDALSLHGQLDLSYHNGDESGSSDDKASIDWTYAGLEVGLGFRSETWRIMPFLRIADVDGDISNGSTQSFELDQNESAGIRFDIFTEPTAFIRIEAVTGADEGGYVTFVRRY